VKEHSVVIAGGGPTGLMLAAELALAGVDVAIIERRASQDLDGSRAGGLHARTLEVLDQRGIADRFVSEGTKHTAFPFHTAPLAISEMPTRHNYVLGLWQKHIERILAGWVLDELEVPIHRNREVTGFTQDDAGIDVELCDGQRMRAQYLVGCDGGRSIVRKTAGIDFAGWDASTSWIIANVEWTTEPVWGFRETATSKHAIGKADNPTYARMVLMEPSVRTDAERSLQDLKQLLVAEYGTDFGVHNPDWISSFTDATRQAVAYRKGRVLLAGDAAHIHPPHGGQGLGLGVQDAVNLGWKLAQVVKGTSPDGLLDTYHAERQPVGARVLKNTMAHVAVARVDARSKALGDYLSELLGMEEPRRRMTAEQFGLGVRYDFGEGHPLLGRRMPDLDIVTADGPRRVFSLLHKARPALLNFGARGSVDVGRWSDRVQLIDVEYSGNWELPAIGTVNPPAAVLIRPDGHVAWVGDGTQAGLAGAMTKWFGGVT
jgi:3-(3-hydroxy-phenyl)propionate hydroxylase